MKKIDEKTYRGEFLQMVEIKRTEKTAGWRVESSSTAVLLGFISWYGNWRKYCFFPHEGTVWDTKCLTEVTQFINDRMQERKSIFREMKLEMLVDTELIVEGFYRGGSKLLSLSLNEINACYGEVTASTITDAAYEELKRQGSGYNSEVVNFYWDETLVDKWKETR